MQRFTLVIAVVALVVAVLPWLRDIVGPEIGGGGEGPGVQFASIAVNCPSGSSFRLSTGNNAGSCQVTKDSAGKVTGGTCGDAEGNSAAAECQSNGGQGACESTSGSGDCN